MPRSTKHKSHRQSKHSSRDYSDSEEDVKMKDKSSKNENLVKVNRDSAYGEKHKGSSQIREGKEVKNIIEHENGGASENYFSSKRRKENSDFGVGGDRWNGGDDEIGKNDRVMENETTKREAFKVESKSIEFSNKGDNSRNKSKKYESGSTEEKKESLGSVVVEEEEGKSKTESKRKSERDYSVQKEGKESKDKDRRQEKEKEKGQERNRVDEVKLADVDVGKRMGLQQLDLGLQQLDLIVERQLKRARENSADFPVHDESRNSEVEKELEKRTRRRREGSNDRGKHHDAFKDGEERGFTSRSDRVKYVKYRDDKHKDEIYADKYHEDDHKDDRQMDEKYHKEISKDNKYRDDKQRIDGEKDGRRREDRHREDDDRENRTKDERRREDGERDTKWRYDNYREGTEKDSRNRDDRRHEDGDRDRRRRDDRYHEDGSKNGRHGDERYYEDGDKDRRGSNSHKEDANSDIRHKEEKHREDVEKESRDNDSKQGSDFDRGKSLREVKYRDERATRDRSVDKSDLKHSIDDGYAADYHSRKTSAYNYNPTHDERTARNRDDQGMRRSNEKGDYNDIRSHTTNDQRFDAEKGGSGSRIDSTPNRGRSTSRNADVEINSSHSRRRSSPSSSSLAPRDRNRLSKQDESKYRDYGYEERHRRNLTSTRDYNNAIGGSEKTSLSWSMEKQVKKDDGHLGDFGERHLKSDSRSSPMQITEKSPPTSIDQRQFSRSDVRRSIDVEESTQRSGGSRDVNEYSGKEGRGRHESVMDMFPGNELSQADAVSVSSPFTRNSHLSGSSKSFPPPPHFRTGVESPLIGSAEDDNRFKSNSRHRRSGDPNMGRAHGNAWRGVPSWPSPVVNGFMPFPHGPPVNFHSVMQPFQTPLFGIRPSMDMNHPAPFHIPNTERFSGPGRPMGWRNPVDDPCPPLHAWDASNTSLRDESHIYGRPGWDHSRNLPDGRGWDTTGDLWKGPNRTASLEMSSSEKENNFAQNAEEVSASQSIRPVWNEQTFPGQQAESNDVNQSNYGSENNAVKTLQIIPEDTSDAAKISKKDDVLLCHVYLSKLDISADLTEPDLLNQCSGFCNMDQIIVSDIDDSKILFIEEAGEARVESHQILRYFLSTPKDDSVFMRAMSLYERQKDSFDKVVAGEKFSIPESHQEEGPDTEDNTAEKQSSVGDILSAEDGPTLVKTDVYANPMNTLLKVEGCTEAAHEKPVLPVAVAIVKSEEPVSTLEISNMQVDLTSNLVQQDHIVEEKHLPVESNKGFDTSLPANMKNDGNIEELNLDGTECVTLLNSDLFSEVSEAMMPESLVSGSVNLSRIHHSPESTH